jgi:hypothetical protein
MGPAYSLFLRRRSVSFWGWNIYLFGSHVELGNPRKKSSFRSILSIAHVMWVPIYLEPGWVPEGPDYLKIGVIVVGVMNLFIVDCEFVEQPPPRFDHQGRSSRS